jgi:hypothetical protein
MAAELSRTPFRIDAVEAATFIIRDPAWRKKVGLGALFTVLRIAVVGIVLTEGYFLMLGERVAQGTPAPLPGWDHPGELLRRGRAALGIYIAYLVPITLVYGYVGLVNLRFLRALVSAGDAAAPAVIAAAPNPSLNCMVTLVAPLALGILFSLQAIYARLILTAGDSRVAFEWHGTVDLIRQYRVQYIILVLLSYGAAYVAALPSALILLFFGALPPLLPLVVLALLLAWGLGGLGSFVAQLFQFHMIGQLCGYLRTQGGADVH